MAPKSSTKSKASTKSTSTGKSSKSGKKVAAAPAVAKKNAPQEQKQKKTNPLFEKRSKNFGIGQDVQPKRDLTRFVKWPKYVQIQRKKHILMKRLKMPPVLNQFNLTADKQTDKEVLKLLKRLRPETQQQRKERLRKEAENRASGKDTQPKKKSPAVHAGIQETTRLIETKKAKLVVIASDVEPIELVLFLPTLCRKMGVPYCIIKSKARLGQIVNRRTCTCMAVVETKSEDKGLLDKVASTCKNNFNERGEEVKRQWGGGVLSKRSRARISANDKARARDMAQRQDM